MPEKMTLGRGLEVASIGVEEEEEEDEDAIAEEVDSCRSWERVLLSTDAAGRKEEDMACW